MVSCLFSPLPLCLSVVEEIVDEEAEKEKRRKLYVRNYVSPWERAMRGNEELTSTMKSSMPGPIYMHADLPYYKSFNRYTDTDTQKKMNAAAPYYTQTCTEQIY